MEACVAKGVEGGRHVHRRLRRDRRRGPGDAGAHHADRQGQRHPAVRPELPRPVQHADRPYADLQLVPRRRADPGRAARHGDAIGRVRHASPGAGGAPRHPGRRLAVDRQRGRRVGRRRHLVPRRRPRDQGDRLLCRGDQGRRAVRRGGGARPRQRQAGHRDEGRQLDGRRRRGGLAHRLAGRRRRDLRRRLPPARASSAPRRRKT